MEEQGYLTVGQLAREVGTTVRTIQYYDQQGLLSPSAKGPGNQRLYSPADVEELYRILVLKYLGLSLADIRERKDAVDDADVLHEVLLQTMASLEEDFQNLVKRLSVLRSLLDRTSEANEVDWVDFARVVEAGDGADGLFWNRFVDEGATSAADDDASENRRAHGLAVAKWHDLVADAIALMTEHVSPGDQRSAELARRYRSLVREHGGSLEQMFILAENMSPHHGGPGSFDELRDSVATYLDDVVSAHGEAQQEEG